MVKDNNNGPVARLVRLPQGHYRRVGSDEAPEFLKDMKLKEQLFEDIRFCFETTCFVSDEEYAKLAPNSEMYTDACSESLQEITDGDEAQLFYTVYSRKVHTVADIGVQTSRQFGISSERGVGESLEFGTEGTKQEDMEQCEEEHAEEMERQHSIPNVVIEQIETPEEIQAKQNAIAECRAKFDVPLEFDINDPNAFRGNGVPTLFYTKSRINPTLVIMTIDYEMQVIYMTRKNINRFFPVKLISRLVTNPEIIQEEFTKQVEADPGIKLTYMIIINAANFTDSVAIQFPDPILKDRFVEDLKRLKNEIRTQTA